jgi:sugar O-acyltransferase (sialic acid O-acetyltransferase NeuD family)
METKDPQPMLILGARIFAREAADWVSRQPEYVLTGFVENYERERCDGTLEGLPILWVDELEKYASTHVCVCAIGTTHRAPFIALARERGMRFGTIVHPSAAIARTAAIGPGCIVGPMAVVGAYTRIGADTIINRGALVGHDIEVGEVVTIGPGAIVGGFTKIGARTFVGMGAKIVDHVTVGAGSMIGAGSLVHKDVGDRVMAVGTPAVVVKRDFEGY